MKLKIGNYVYWLEINAIWPLFSCLNAFGGAAVLDGGWEPVLYLDGKIQKIYFSF